MPENDKDPVRDNKTGWRKLTGYTRDLAAALWGVAVATPRLIRLGARIVIYNVHDFARITLRGGDLSKQEREISDAETKRCTAQFFDAAEKGLATYARLRRDPQAGLMSALELVNPAMVEEFLKKGADPDFSGRYFLFMGMSEIFSPPLQHYSYWGVKDSSEETQSTFKTKELLLKYGANPNIRDKYNDNKTPLHIATLNNDTKLTELLLRHGADPDLRDDDGITPLDIAKKCHLADITAVFDAHRAHKEAEIRAREKAEQTSRSKITHVDRLQQLSNLITPPKRRRTNGS